MKTNNNYKYEGTDIRMMPGDKICIKRRWFKDIIGTLVDGGGKDPSEKRPRYEIGIGVAIYPSSNIGTGFANPHIEFIARKNDYCYTYPDTDMRILIGDKVRIKARGIISKLLCGEKTIVGTVIQVADASNAGVEFPDRIYIDEGEPVQDIEVGILIELPSGDKYRAFHPGPGLKLISRAEQQESNQIHGPRKPG